MFCFCMIMIQSIKHNVPIFKGYHGLTKEKQADGSVKTYIHQTSFMRDFSVLDFSQKYIKENFPYGTHIADFACSQGQEAYSIAILLDAANKDKKYKITGYDTVPSLIKQAKKGAFIFESYGNELMLFDKPTALTEPEQECILVTPKGNIKHKTKIYKPDYPLEKASEVRNTFNKYFSVLKLGNDEIKNFINDFLPAGYWEPSTTKKAIIVNEEKTRGILDFKTENINKIDKILEPQKTGAVFFQNALYHITNCTASNSDSAIIEPANVLFKKIHKILPDKGIFVMGRLMRDHLLNYNEKNSRLIYQNGKSIKVLDSSLIHDSLRSNGFEPIFYEIDASFRKIYLPAIWRKIPKK